jgi:L-alanine-DL-glutamate epimerase-like enolase superfamily enzyme
MKITKVTAMPVRLDPPFGDYAGTAGLHGDVEGDQIYRRVRPYRALFSRYVESLLVAVECDSGLVGWGESQAGVGPSVVGTIVDELLAPMLIGRDPRQPMAIWHDLYDSMRDRGHGGGFMLDAIAGVDIALWDLCGKIYNQPVHRLLGGTNRPAIPLYLSGPRGSTVKERIADAEGFVLAGFSSVKLFIGRGVEDDIAEVGAFRGHFGSTVDLMVDAQWMYSPHQALRLGKALEPLGVRFFETPIAREDLRGHRLLARSLSIPIAVGETERTRWEIWPYINYCGIGVVQPDVGRCGISEALHVAALASVYDLPIAFHCGVGFGPYVAAALQAAAATPNLLYVEYQPDMHRLASEVYGFTVPVESGQAIVTQVAGLGMDAPSARLTEASLWAKKDTGDGNCQ